MSNPLRLVRQIGKQYPECWKIVEEFRRQQVAKNKEWPKHCYLPAHIGNQIVFDNGGIAAWFDKQKNGIMTAEFDRAFADVGRITSLATWRMTQGIYRFDQTLYSELLETEVIALPRDVLLKLPEWCVYIELNNAPSKGVFAHLQFDPADKSEKLCLTFDTTGNTDGLWTIQLNLIDSLKYEQAEAKKDRENQTSDSTTELLGTQLSGSAGLSGVLSLLLYLCSANADYQEAGAASNSKTRGVVRKKVTAPKGPTASWNNAPPKQDKRWEVGYRIGPVLRKSIDKPPAQCESTESTGRTVRPHIRRSHWHHFWKGKRDKKQLILKWIPPTLVNVDDLDALPMTVRPVRK